MAGYSTAADLTVAVHSLNIHPSGGQVNMLNARKETVRRTGSMARGVVCALLIAGIVCGAVNAVAHDGFETDRFETCDGPLDITFIGHGTLMFEYGGTVIHVDPWGRLADYDALPKADMIFLTHEHLDHLDPEAIETVSKPETVLIYTEACSGLYDRGIVMENGDRWTVRGLRVHAVPAYNMAGMREPNVLYHPKGDSNGYIFHFGDLRVYVGAETEVIPEMRDLGHIDVAFLAMDCVYNMDEDMCAEAVRIIRPRVFYPYHYRDADTSRLAELLADMPDVEVRIRRMQ